MGEMFDQMDVKELRIDWILAGCEIHKLREVFSNVFEGEDLTSLTSVLDLMGKFRDKMKSLNTKEEKGRFLLSLIPVSPREIASQISDVLIKGEGVTLTHKSVPEKTEVKTMNVLRKEFRIIGVIGRKREHLSFLSIDSQIREALTQGFTENEIVSAIKRAVGEKEIRSYLESKPELSLVNIIQFLESVLKEKSAAEFFQELSGMTQKQGESADSFAMRAMDIRQKCLIASKRTKSVSFPETLVQSVFLATVRLGIIDDNIKLRFENVMRTKTDISDNNLLQELSIITREETERKVKLQNESDSITVKSAKVQSKYHGNDSLHPSNSGLRLKDGMQDKEFRQLSEQVTALTTEIERIKDAQKQTQTKNTTNTKKPYILCHNCQSNNSNSCNHCWKCGRSGHISRNCRSSN